MDTRRGGSICPVSSGPPIRSDHRLALVETEESTILGTPPARFYALEPITHNLYLPHFAHTKSKTPKDSFLLE